MSTTFKRQDDGKKGSIYILENENPAGKIEYVWAGDDKFIIEHTEVDEAYGGKGYGKSLVMEAAAMAREKNVKIIPICPYAKKVFDREESIQDVKK